VSELFIDDRAKLCTALPKLKLCKVKKRDELYAIYLYTELFRKRYVLSWSSAGVMTQITSICNNKCNIQTITMLEIINISKNNYCAHW